MVGKMTATEQKAEIIRKSRDVLIPESGVRLALIYGSYATGKMRMGSDVDIAVLFDRPLDVGRRLALVEQLESALSLTIDLADLYAMSGTILRQILCKGQVLVKNDPVAMETLIRRMIYNQADMMPIVLRTLEERQKRFVYG